MPAPEITQEMIDTYQREGVVLVKGLWADWVDTIRAQDWPPNDAG